MRNEKNIIDAKYIMPQFASVIAPSMNSLFITGMIVLFIFYLVVVNFRQLMQLDFYRKIQILSLITIAVGVHGLIHLGVEVSYGFNPYKLLY